MQAKAEEFARLLKEYEDSLPTERHNYHDLEVIDDLEPDLMELMLTYGVGGIDTVAGRIVIVCDETGFPYLEIEASHFEDYPDRSQWVWRKTKGWQWRDAQ